MEKFNHNGVTYVAIEQDGCRNCAFSCKQSHDNMWGCSAPHGAPECCAEGRSDKCNVVFVERDGV